MRSFVLSILILSVPHHTCAAEPQCITQIEVPQLQDSIVSMPGRVEADVRIGKYGKPQSVKLEASNKVLALEVERLLKRETEYSAACEGDTIHLKFTYVVEGAPVRNLQWKVLFRPPHEFTIVSRPIIPVAIPLAK